MIDYLDSSSRLAEMNFGWVSSAVLLNIMIYWRYSVGRANIIVPLFFIMTKNSDNKLSYTDKNTVNLLVRFCAKTQLP